MSSDKLRRERSHEALTKKEKRFVIRGCFRGEIVKKEHVTSPAHREKLIFPAPALLPSLHLRVRFPLLKVTFFSSPNSRANRLMGSPSETVSEIGALSIRDVSLDLVLDSHEADRRLSTIVRNEKRRREEEREREGEGERREKQEEDHEQDSFPFLEKGGVCPLSVRFSVRRVRLSDSFTPGTLYSSLLRSGLPVHPSQQHLPLVTFIVSIRQRHHIYPPASLSPPPDVTLSENSQRVEEINIYGLVRPLAFLANTNFLLRLASFFEDASESCVFEKTTKRNRFLSSILGKEVPPFPFRNRFEALSSLSGSSPRLFLDVTIDSPKVLIPSQWDSRDSGALVLTTKKLRIFSDADAVCSVEVDQQDLSEEEEEERREGEREGGKEEGREGERERESEGEGVVPTKVQPLVYEQHRLSIFAAQIAVTVSREGRWYFERVHESLSPETSLLQPIDWDVSFQRAIVSHPRLPLLRIIGDLPNANLNISVQKLEIFMRTVALVLYDPPWVKVPLHGWRSAVPKEICRDPIQTLRFLRNVQNVPVVELHVSLLSLSLTIHSKHKDSPPPSSSSPLPSSSAQEILDFGVPQTDPILVAITIDNVLLELGVRDFDQYVTAAAGGVKIVGTNWNYKKEREREGGRERERERGRESSRFLIPFPHKTTSLSLSLSFSLSLRLCPCGQFSI